MPVTPRILSALLGFALLSEPATAQQTLDPQLETALVQATSAPQVMATITDAIAPLVADICTRPDWAGTAAAMDRHKATFTRFGLVPSITGDPNQGLLQLYVWGPDLNDAAEALNPDLGYLSLNIWITVLLLDHGTHRTLFCRYGALDNGPERAVLPVLAQAFKSGLPQMTQTADHTAPMLHQKPDVLRIEIWQSPDQATHLELRAGGTRIDAVLNRRLDGAADGL